MSEELDKLAADPELRAELAKRLPAPPAPPAPAVPKVVAKPQNWPKKTHHINPRCPCRQCAAYKARMRTIRIDKMKAIAAKLDAAAPPKGMRVIVDEIQDMPEIVRKFSYPAYRNGEPVPSTRNIPS